MCALLSCFANELQIESNLPKPRVVWFGVSPASIGFLRIVVNVIVIMFAMKTIAKRIRKMFVGGGWVFPPPFGHIFFGKGVCQQC